ncbi:MAG: hypothetical protein JSV03_15415, partial [Planctomycetota bacterium]
MQAVLITLVTVFCSTFSAVADARPLDTCIPGNAMAVYFGRPSADTPTTRPTSTLNQLAAWVIALKAMGVIPHEGRLIADIMATLPMLGERSYAVALLDITARKLGPGSYRLNDMQAALIVDTQGIQVAFDRRIRDLLATYTDAENGTIDALRFGDVSYHRLTDKRLPEWAITEWCTVGDLLIVSFGKGAFEQVVNTVVKQSPSLAKVAWYRKAHRRCHGPASRIEVYVDIAQIKARLNEVIVG